MAVQVTLEELAQPEFLDNFFGMRTFIHTKVMLNGRWLLSIKAYDGLGERPKRKADPDPVDDEDEDDEDDDCAPPPAPPEVVNHGTKAVPGYRWEEFRVQTNEADWPLLAFNHGDKYPTIAAARKAAEDAAHRIAQFFLDIYPFVAGSSEPARKKFKFRYGPGFMQTVTVIAYDETEAKSRAAMEMRKRFTEQRKALPNVWAFELIASWPAAT